ncbi:uncharacterized protein [Paramormyrops kingsleyae]|uniref:uncharacterized protein isoform X2 n=1 Tax=Paramormyrops kingsleyae TaxID=1676925 RepID=UPI003B96ADCC
MTRLDPASCKPCRQSWMEESSSRDSFGRHTGSLANRGQEVGLPLRRAGSCQSLRENSPSPPFRHYEVGRPLPSTRLPEPKASIPFRNPDLGMPSKRRGSGVDPFGRSPSPPKYSLHSNFRVGPQGRGPRSPSPCTLIPTPFKQAELGASQQWSFDGFYPKVQVPSRSSSGISKSSPRHGSTFSLSSSPSRSPSPFKQNGIPFSNYTPAQEREEPRSPSKSSNGPKLDSEYLCKDVDTTVGMTASCSSAFSETGSKAELHSSSRFSGQDDQSHPSSHRNCEAPENSPSQANFIASTSSQDASILRPTTLSGSWMGSVHSYNSTTALQTSSTPGRLLDTKPTIQLSKSHTAAMETDDWGRGTSGNERGLELRSPSPEYTRSSHQSPSPQRRRHTISQSSLESESSRTSSGSGVACMKMEDYVVMADIPKTKVIYPREAAWEKGRSQSHSPIRPYKQIRPTDGHQEWGNSVVERGRGMERGRTRQKRQGGDSERVPCVRSTASLSAQGDHREETLTESDTACLQMGPVEHRPTEKGWMSKLDDDGEWRKHWFVLTDASLRFYRDARAEEKEDLDGEIDLRSCVGVSEFDVEKNYGFQIQTQGAVFTLSAMTSGIRRNWLEVLRKNVLPSSSPDIMQLSDSRSDKEIRTSCPVLPAHRDSGSEVMTPTPHQLDCVELAPVMDTQAPAQPVSTPETKEGLDREQARRLEDRTRWFQAAVPAKEPPPGSSPWDTVHLKKGTSSASNLEETLERKWVEFERLPLREMRSLPLIGSCANQPANEVLLKEVALLKAQVEQLQKVRFAREGGKCGLEAPCGRSLEAMEKAHREVLEELQRRHEREVRKLEVERDRLLREEAQATAQAMEVLKTALRVELEEEVARARRLGGGTAEPQALPQTQSERLAQQRELDSLSERYSQKCLEVRRAEERHREMEREASRRETELEQLKKENWDLQSHLMKEISHMRSSSEHEGSDGVLHDSHERSSCELEVLLRVKENEVQYLHKEIGCLRDELLSLSKEKRLAYERCKEANVELNAAKNRSERELEALREHLRLAMAALREGQELGNSMSH